MRTKHGNRLTRDEGGYNGMLYDIYWARKPRKPGNRTPHTVAARGVVAFTLYNSLKFCEGCIKSLSQHLPPDVDILAIDNGSTENLAAVLAERYPHIHCLRVHENKGVASGFNAACEFVFGHGAGCIYLANDDILAQPSFWEHCEGEMLARGPGLVASIARDALPPHNIQSAGVEVNLSRLKVKLRNNGAPYDESLRTFIPCDAFVGVGFMIAREVWEKLGKFDERYYVLFEETDYCTRARKAGFSVGVAGASTLLHFESQTVGPFPSARYLYFYLRNQIWFGRMNMSEQDFRVWGYIAPIKKALLFIYRERIVRKSPKRIRAMFTGIYHGLFHELGDNRIPSFLTKRPL